MAPAVSALSAGAVVAAVVDVAAAAISGGSGGSDDFSDRGLAGNRLTLATKANANMPQAQKRGPLRLGELGWLDRLIFKIIAAAAAEVMRCGKVGLFEIGQITSPLAVFCGPRKKNNFQIFIRGVGRY